jgi:hypothetical protein
MSQDTQPQEFDLNAIFNRKAPVTDPIVEEKEEEIPKKKQSVTVKEVKKEPVQELDDEEEPETETEEEDVKSEEPEPKKEEKPKDKIIDYKLENEKLQKTLKDTQKSFHEDRRKLSAYKRAVEKMKEDGVLLEDEATLLLDHTQYQEETHSSGSDPVLVKYGKIWDKELEYMRKYSSDAGEINKNVFAFQHLIQSSSTEEVEDIFYDLAQYEDDEVELTKRMISYGREYNDEIYSDIHEAGSIRKLKSKYQSEIDSIKKELDKTVEKYNKLKKKHQDYDTEPANLRISSGAAHVGDNKDGSMDFGKMFKDKFHRR